MLRQPRLKGRGRGQLFSDAGEFAETPNSIGGKQSEDAGHSQAAVSGFEEVGTDSGNEDKHEWKRHELKTQSLVVRRHETQNMQRTATSSGAEFPK